MTETPTDRLADLADLDRQAVTMEFADSAALVAVCTIAYRNQ
jgi:hypothetical protein